MSAKKEPKPRTILEFIDKNAEGLAYTVIVVLIIIGGFILKLYGKD